MNKELQERIKKLKDPKQAQPFCLRSPEERNAITNAKFHNTLFLTSTLVWEKPVGGPPTKRDTYILKPDYEPKPEYEEWEIKTLDPVTLRAHSPNDECSMSLTQAMQKSNFVCFHDPFGKETTNAGDVPGWMRVLAAQDGDIKMHARFEKGVK